MLRKKHATNDPAAGLRPRAVSQFGKKPAALAPGVAEVKNHEKLMGNMGLREAPVDICCRQFSSLHIDLAFFFPLGTGTSAKFMWLARLEAFERVSQALLHC